MATSALYLYVKRRRRKLLHIFILIAALVLCWKIFNNRRSATHRDVRTKVCSTFFAVLHFRIEIDSLYIYSDVKESIKASLSAYTGKVEEYIFIDSKITSNGLPLSMEDSAYYIKGSEMSRGECGYVWRFNHQDKEIKYDTCTEPSLEDSWKFCKLPKEMFSPTQSTEVFSELCKPNLAASWPLQDLRKCILKTENDIHDWIEYARALDSDLMNNIFSKAIGYQVTSWQVLGLIIEYDQVINDVGLTILNTTINRSQNNPTSVDKAAKTLIQGIDDDHQFSTTPLLAVPSKSQSTYMERTAGRYYASTFKPYSKISSDILIPVSISPAVPFTPSFLPKLNPSTVGAHSKVQTSYLSPILLYTSNYVDSTSKRAEPMQRMTTQTSVTRAPDRLIPVSISPAVPFTPSFLPKLYPSTVGAHSKVQTFYLSPLLLYTSNYVDSTSKRAEPMQRMTTQTTVTRAPDSSNSYLPELEITSTLDKMYRPITDLKTFKREFETPSPLASSDAMSSSHIGTTTLFSTSNHDAYDDLLYYSMIRQIYPEFFSTLPKVGFEIHSTPEVLLVGEEPEGSGEFDDMFTDAPQNNLFSDNVTEEELLSEIQPLVDDLLKMEENQSQQIKSSNVSVLPSQASIHSPNMSKPTNLTSYRSILENDFLLLKSLVHKIYGVVLSSFPLPLQDLMSTIKSNSQRHRVIVPHESKNLELEFNPNKVEPSLAVITPVNKTATSLTRMTIAPTQTSSRLTAEEGPSVPFTSRYIQSELPSVHSRFANSNVLRDLYHSLVSELRGSESLIRNMIGPSLTSTPTASSKLDAVNQPFHPDNTVQNISELPAKTPDILLKFKNLSSTLQHSASHSQSVKAKPGSFSPTAGYDKLEPSNIKNRSKWSFLRTLIGSLDIDDDATTSAPAISSYGTPRVTRNKNMIYSTLMSPMSRDTLSDHVDSKTASVEMHTTPNMLTVTHGNDEASPTLQVPSPPLESEPGNRVKIVHDSATNPLFSSQSFEMTDAHVHQDTTEISQNPPSSPESTFTPTLEEKVQQKSEDLYNGSPTFPSSVLKVITPTSDNVHRTDSILYERYRTLDIDVPSPTPKPHPSFYSNTLPSSLLTRTLDLTNFSKSTMFSVNPFTVESGSGHTVIPRWDSTDISNQLFMRRNTDEASGLLMPDASHSLEDDTLRFSLYQSEGNMLPISSALLNSKPQTTATPTTSYFHHIFELDRTLHIDGGIVTQNPSDKISHLQQTLSVQQNINSASSALISSVIYKPSSSSTTPDPGAKVHTKHLKTQTVESTPVHTMTLSKSLRYSSGGHEFLSIFPSSEAGYASSAISTEINSIHTSLSSAVSSHPSSPSSSLNGLSSVINLSGQFEHVIHSTIMPSETQLHSKFIPQDVNQQNEASASGSGSGNYLDALFNNETFISKTSIGVETNSAEGNQLYLTPLLVTQNPTTPTPPPHSVSSFTSLYYEPTLPYMSIDVSLDSRLSFPFSSFVPSITVQHDKNSITAHPAVLPTAVTPSSKMKNTELFSRSFSKHLKSKSNQQLIPPTSEPLPPPNTHLITSPNLSKVVTQENEIENEASTSGSGSGNYSDPFDITTKAPSDTTSYASASVRESFTMKTPSMAHSVVSSAYIRTVVTPSYIYSIYQSTSYPSPSLLLVTADVPSSVLVDSTSVQYKKVAITSTISVSLLSQSLLPESSKHPTESSKLSSKNLKTQGPVEPSFKILTKTTSQLPAFGTEVPHTADGTPAPVIDIASAVVGKSFEYSVPTSWSEILAQDSHAYITVNLTQVEKISTGEDLIVDNWLEFIPEFGIICGVPVTKDRGNIFQISTFLISLQSNMQLVLTPILLHVSLYTSHDSLPDYEVITDLDVVTSNEDNFNLFSEGPCLFANKLASFLQISSQEVSSVPNIIVLTFSSISKHTKRSTKRLMPIKVVWTIDNTTAEAFNSFYRPHIMDNETAKMSYKFFVAMLPEFVVTGTNVTYKSVVVSTTKPIAHALSSDEEPVALKAILPPILIGLFLLVSSVALIAMHRKRGPVYYVSDKLFDKTYGPNRKPIYLDEEIEMDYFKPGRPRIIIDDYTDSSVAGYNNTSFYGSDTMSVISTHNQSSSRCSSGSEQASNAFSTNGSERGRYKVSERLKFTVSPHKQNNDHEGYYLFSSSTFYTGKDKPDDIRSIWSNSS